MANSKTIGADEIHAAIDRLAAGISARHRRNRKLLLLGIANGGIELARRLAARLGHTASQRPPVAGIIDISFHRDDIARHPVPKEFVPTQIPADVDGATVILVDDVLFSGRTVKAALDELFDHGRPAQVELAVMIDRGGRRLPIAADYIGLTVAAGEQEKVLVTLDPKQPRHDAVKIVPAPLAAQNPAL